MPLTRRLLLSVLSACFILSGCGPAEVAMLTNTPRPPGVSVATSTLAATLTPIPTDTIPASPTITLTPSITLTASSTTTGTATFTFTPSLTPTATNTRTPYPTKVRGASLTPFPTLAALTGALEPHLWFARPIGDDYENFVTRTYTYGNTMSGTLPPHHGVEFYNPQGTPILAAGDGIVVFAGPDVGGAAISPQPNFYGNAVVIEHTQSLNGQPVFTLYGHMSFVAVARGQAVHTGDEIGKVGGTGVALGGTHLHFEVRVGYNDYESTRNPELWLASFPRWGTLVGRVVDKNGQLLPLVSVGVRSQDIEEEGPVNRFVTTYAIETINPDSAYGENFAIMDLPPGTYTVQVGGTKTITQTVTIKPDGLTFVEFRDVNPPPTWTVTPTASATEKP
jgi:murein DD-endopeptidase MepM/ murein hydrolase activator NlpD